MKAARNEMVFISDVWGLIGLVVVIPILEDSQGRGGGLSMVWEVGAGAPPISNTLWVWF